MLSRVASCAQPHPRSAFALPRPLVDHAAHDEAAPVASPAGGGHRSRRRHRPLSGTSPELRRRQVQGPRGAAGRVAVTQAAVVATARLGGGWGHPQPSARQRRPAAAVRESGGTQTPSPSPPPPPHMQVLIQFEAGGDRAAALRGMGAKEKRVIANHGGAPLVVATLPPGLAVADAVDSLNSRAGVRFAEPNFQYTKARARASPGRRWQLCAAVATPNARPPRRPPPRTESAEPAPG